MGTGISKEQKAAYDREYRAANKERLQLQKKQYDDSRKDKKREYDRAYREKNREHLNEVKREYTANHKQRKSEYDKQYHALNQSKHADRAKEYYINNVDKIAEYQRKYNQENPGHITINSQRRKARKRELPHTFTISEWAECKNHFNNQCAYCGRKEELTQEHFIPLVRGGAYVKENIIPACKSCNCSKSDREFSEWYPKQKRYSEKREQAIYSYLNQGYSGEQTSLILNSLQA